MSDAVTGVPLVTGAAGFAGSHLLDRLTRSGQAIAAWSYPSTSRLPPAPSSARWEEVDVLDAGAVEGSLRRLRPSVIFHCAGAPHVAEAWDDTAKPLRVNAFGTHVLLEAVERTELQAAVVLVGSALVYRAASRPLNEDDPVGPSDPYGVSKLAQEMAGAQARTRVLLVRPFNHAGPRQPASFVTSSFARQIAEIEAGRREPVLRVGNLDARRDITDVRDTVRAYEMLAARGRPGRPYNVCTGRAHVIGELLDMLLGMARLSVRVEQDPARLRPSDNPLVVGDPSRIQSEVGWQAEIPIERTLADLLEWWRTEVRSGQDQ